jgi:hypothetical protein
MDVTNLLSACSAVTKGAKHFAADGDLPRIAARMPGVAG